MPVCCHAGEQAIIGFIPHFCFAAQPNWIQKINDVHAAIEENVFWECHASGRPKPSYRWLKDGEPLLPQVGVLILLMTS